MGYLEKRDPDPWRSRGQVGLEEFDTFSCCHCNRVVKLVLNKDPHPARAAFEVRKSQVSMCRRCGDFVCDPCTALSCDPVEAKLGRFERGLV